MNPFVDTCRKGWDRLGVPEAVASEMATDLEADLSEAQADGVSPEEVLGNGYFDAKAFAASWATARGIVSPASRLPHSIRTRSVALGLSAFLCLAAGALGLLILVGRRVGSASAAVAVRRSVPGPIPGIFVSPHRFGFVESGGIAGPGGPLDVVGLVLLVAALVGAIVTLWLWKPWSSRSNPPELDRNVGMPTFL
jgi:hypothetical protein